MIMICNKKLVEENILLKNKLEYMENRAEEYRTLYYKASGNLDESTSNYFELWKSYNELKKLVSESDDTAWIKYNGDCYGITHIHYDKEVDCVEHLRIDAVKTPIIEPKKEEGEDEQYENIGLGIFYERY